MEVQKIEIVHTRAPDAVLAGLEARNPQTVIDGSYDKSQDVWVFVIKAPARGN